tara:strand:+ start:5027 stop:5212 length:186 start_codon:yes stop_codon:yes gene_type:complete
MGKIIQDYEKLLLSLPELMKESNYKTAFFISILNIPSSTFYRKLKGCSFTIDECKKLSNVL